MSTRRRRHLRPVLDQLDDRCLLSGLTPAQLTGDFYAACTNVKAVDAAGIEPLTWEMLASMVRSGAIIVPHDPPGVPLRTIGCGADATAGQEPAPVPHEPMPGSGATKTVAPCEVNLPATAASAARAGNN